MQTLVSFSLTRPWPCTFPPSRPGRSQSRLGRGSFRYPAHRRLGGKPDTQPAAPDASGGGTPTPPTPRSPFQKRWIHEVVDTRSGGPGRVDQRRNARWVDPGGVARAGRAGWVDPGRVARGENGRWDGRRGGCLQGKRGMGGRRVGKRRKGSPKDYLRTETSGDVKLNLKSRISGRTTSASWTVMNSPQLVDISLSIYALPL